MNPILSKWTPEQVEARFAEAAKTARCLPAARLPEYASAWPALQRMATALGKHSGEGRKLRIPLSPAAVDRMLETIRWMQWLDTEARHLVWMRADRWDWQEICRRVGYDRTTAWRRWKKALRVVVAHLNDRDSGKLESNSAF